VKVRLLSVFIVVSTAIGSGVSVLSTDSLASAAGTSSASSQYLNGPSHSSYYPSATSITPQAIAAGNLQPLWRWSVPASPNSGHSSMLASPAIVNGVIYIGANDGYFYAVSESSRSVLWSQFIGIDTGKPNGSCGTGTAGIISTAAVVTDPTTGKLTVYVNGPDGNLYALNAATGKIVWKSVVDTPSTLVNDYYAWGSPLVVNGKVYIGISSECDAPLVPGGLDAFNQSTGALLATWNSVPAGALGGSIWSSAAALSNGAVIATTGNANTATQPPHNESIVRLGGTNLQLLDSWQLPTSQVVTDADFGASPAIFTAVINGVSTTMVGACNKNGIFYALAANHLNAGPVWQTRLTRPYITGNQECIAGAVWNGTSLIVSGGDQTTINGNSYLGSVRALNPATGAPLWQTGLPGSVVGTPTEDGSGVLAVPLYLADQPADWGYYFLNAATGSVIGRITLPNSYSFAQPIFTGNDVMVEVNGSTPALEAYGVTAPGPKITSVSPTPVPLGKSRTVTLTGSGFSGTPQVFVSGTGVTATSVKVVSPTSLTVQVAATLTAGTGYGDISVIEPGSPNPIADTCHSCITIGAPPTSPTVTSVSPPSLAPGQSGASITVSGTGFVFGATVTTVSGISLSTTTWLSATGLGVTASVDPSVAPGTYNVVVTNPDGTSATCVNCLTVT